MRWPGMEHRITNFPPRRQRINSNYNPPRKSGTGGETGDEARGHGDFRFQEPGDGAIGFGGLSGLLERGFVGIRNARGDIEMNFRDGETGFEFFERDRSAGLEALRRDRKSTRLNSSHPSISYAVFCLKKKKKNFLNST